MGQYGSSEDKNGYHGTTSRGNTGGSSTGVGHDKKHHEQEAPSPRKEQHTKGKKVIDNTEMKEVGKELFLRSSKGQGTERKQTRTCRSRQAREVKGDNSEEAQDAMAMILVEPNGAGHKAMENADIDLDLGIDDGETTKKLRKDTAPFSDELAEAAGQPRRAP